VPRHRRSTMSPHSTPPVFPPTYTHTLSFSSIFSNPFHSRSVLPVSIALFLACIWLPLLPILLPWTYCNYSLPYGCRVSAIIETRFTEPWPAARRLFGFREKQIARRGVRDNWCSCFWRWSVRRKRGEFRERRLWMFLSHLPPPHRRFPYHSARSSTLRTHPPRSLRLPAQVFSRAPRSLPPSFWSYPVTLNETLGPRALRRRHKDNMKKYV